MDQNLEGLSAQWRSLDLSRGQWEATEGLISVFFILKTMYIFRKMHTVGASSPTVILGSLDNFLEQERAVGRTPKQKMSKRPLLPNEWSAVLLGAALLTPSPGNPGSPAHRLLKLPVPSETGSGLAPCVQSEGGSLHLGECLFIHFRTESTLIHFEEKELERSWH